MALARARAHVSTDLFSGLIPFVQVAEASSFRGAARQLGVTPAAVSKAVAKLEDELGVKLFHRTSRHVSLTEEGETFLARCQEAIAQVRVGREQLTQAQRAPRGRLHMTTSPILVRTLMPELARFTQRYPAITLDLTVTDREAHLADEAIDVAIRVGHLADSSLVKRLLRRTRWVTVASPEYLARHRPPSRPGDLVRHACMKFVTPRGTEAPWTFRDPKTGADAHTAVDGPMRVDLGEALVEAAIQGMGICQALDFMVERLVTAGRLIEVLPDFSADGPPIHAVTLSGKRPTRVRAFLAFLGGV